MGINMTKEKKGTGMFKMHDPVWSQNTHLKKKSGSKTAEAPSITYDLKWLQERTHSVKKRKTGLACLIERINNIELAVDWWSLQNDQVTWRQASSHSQAWGTLSKLQTGDSFICNTEEPVYRRVHTKRQIGYNIWNSQWELGGSIAAICAALPHQTYF